MSESTHRVGQWAAALRGEVVSPAKITRSFHLLVYNRGWHFPIKRGQAITQTSTGVTLNIVGGAEDIDDISSMLQAPHG